MEMLKKANEIALAASEASADGQAAYLLTVETLLVGLLGGDMVIWNGIDAHRREVVIAGSVADEWRWLVPVLLKTAEANPLVKHFVDAPGLAAPTRMSDLVELSTLRAGRLYAELWRPMGAEFQIGIPTHRSGRGVSRGWAVNRAASDFTADQVEALTALQPALAALEDMVEMGAALGGESVVRPSEVAEERLPQRLALTRRESQVLDLIGLGWTAQHVGHHLRISPATVRKHLEHIYAKLGTHDRLTAVLAASAHRS